MRLMACLSLLVLTGTISTAAEKTASKPSSFQGKVVPLAALLKQKGISLDDDALPSALALQTDDGKIYPLIKNDGSRMFFKDKTLQGRSVRLMGRLAVGMLDVGEVFTLVKGKPHQVYYWCENCSLAYSEPGTCLCCGEPVKLKEVEVSLKAEKPHLLLPKND